MPIERDIIRELRNVDAVQCVTISRAVARELTNIIGMDAELDGEDGEFSTAIDTAQGHDNVAERYVLLYIEPGDL